jgi:uncharacterized protein (TIGR02996 family)
MTTDELALRAAIKAAPLDRAPLLVFADWLDDHGRPDAARHYRHLGNTLGEPKKPTIPEYLDRFVAYLNAHGAWGSLHIVLDDGNVEDDHVRWCIQYAAEHGDEEGRQLGEVLLRMSRTRLPRVAWGRSDWAVIHRNLTGTWVADMYGNPPDIHVGPDGQTVTVANVNLVLGPNGLIGFAAPTGHPLHEYEAVQPTNPAPMIPDPEVKKVFAHVAKTIQERANGQSDDQ